MKKQLLLTRMLLLVALLVGSVSNVWATSYISYNGNTQDTSTSISSRNVSSGSAGKISWTGTSCSYSSSDKRVNIAANGSITFTASSGYNITKIVITSGSSPAYYGTWTSSPSVTPTSSSGVTTFDGLSANSVTVTTSTAFRCTNASSIKIYYTESSDPSSAAAFTNTTPEINYPATKTYSQEPTTADGYNGNISYEITANTAGATINGETGLVTVTKGGSVTVKATAPAITGFKKSEATYTLTVNDTRAEAGLAWSATSASINYDETPYNLPTLTNSNSLAVTYTSTNSSVATVDENTGQVSVKNVTGNTTISAIFAGNDDYKDQTVTYTLNVTKGAFRITDGVFDFDEAGSAIPLEDYGSGITLTSTNVYDYDDSTWEAGNVTMVVSGKYRWWQGSSDNTLRLYSNNPNSACEFSVPDDYYITKIVIVTTSGNFYSASTGLLKTNTWTGVAQSVKLIATSGVNIKKFEVTYTPVTFETSEVTSAGWGTYVTPYPVSFTAGNAYVVKSADENTILEEVTNVPAETPVLLKGEGAKTVTVVTTDVDAPTSNLLNVSTGTNEYNNDNFYVLANKAAGVGFYKWTGDHAIPAGKVYLDTTGVGAKGLEYFSLDESIIDENETTKINAASVENIISGQFYNLAGQRVSNPTKGLYIVNGKKVIIK